MHAKTLMYGIKYYCILRHAETLMQVKKLMHAMSS